MSASLTWQGLQALGRELGGFPAVVRPLVAGRLLAGATRAADRVRQRYDAIPRREDDPDGPGLSKGVRVDATDPLAPRVLNRSPHAHLYEFGTAGRRVTGGTRVRRPIGGRWVTLGASRGRMPAARVFVPIVEAEREQVARELGEVFASPEVRGHLQVLEWR